VLCVDDEPFVLTMLAECAAELGLRPAEAASGEEALALLAAEPFQLLITDIRLGGIDGWEVAEEARVLYPDLPVIYVSGFPTQGKSVPGAVYIAKPFRPHEIERAIRALLHPTELA
jgi:CheY-like chemotaxis protein